MDLNMLIMGENGFGILDEVQIDVKNVDKDQAQLLVDSLRNGLNLTTADYTVNAVLIDSDNVLTRI